MNKFQQKKRQQHEHQRSLKRGFIREMGTVCITRIQKLLKLQRTRDELIVLRRMLRAQIAMK